MQKGYEMIKLLSNVLKSQSAIHGKRTLSAMEEFVIRDLKHLIVPLEVFELNKRFCVQYVDNKYGVLFLPSDFNDRLDIKFKKFDKAITRFGGTKQTEKFGYQTGFKLRFATLHDTKKFIKWYEDNIARKARLILARHVGV